MKRVGLTRKQQALFAFVEAEILADRPAPSYDEILVHLGLVSKSAVHSLVIGVVERGWLVHIPNRARSLALPGAVRSKDLRSAEAERRAVRDTGFSISLPTELAARLAAYCEPRRRAPADVVREALDAHLRWPS